MRRWQGRQTHLSFRLRETKRQQKYYVLKWPQCSGLLIWDCQPSHGSSQAGNCDHENLLPKLFSLCWIELIRVSLLSVNVQNGWDFRKQMHLTFLSKFWGISLKLPQKVSTYINITTMSKYPVKTEAVAKLHKTFTGFYGRNYPLQIIKSPDFHLVTGKTVLWFFVAGSVSNTSSQIPRWGTGPWAQQEAVKWSCGGCLCFVPWFLDCPSLSCSLFCVVVSHESGQSLEFVLHGEICGIWLQGS